MPKSIASTVETVELLSKASSSDCDDSSPKSSTTRGLQKVRMLADIKENIDLNDERGEYTFTTPEPFRSFLGSRMNDEKDWAIVHMLFNVVTILIPLVTAFWYVCLTDLVPTWAKHLLGCGYFALLGLGWEERFILGMHYASHRPIFKKDDSCGQIFNALPHNVLCMLWGIPPSFYKLHHCYMHHAANNSGDDISATEHYNRGEFRDFLKYWFRFFVTIHIEFPGVVIRSKPAPSLSTWIFELLPCLLVDWLYLFSVAYFTYQYPVPAMYTLTLPWILTGFMLAFGNWGQHIFVDPDDHANNFKLTVNIMNSKINKNNFNDGYHILHHQNSRLHWADMPKAFLEPEWQRKHIENGAITFNGDISFFDISAYVLSGNLRSLIEQYYVHLGDADTCPTVDEVVAECERRMKKFDSYLPQRYGGPMPNPTTLSQKLKGA